MARSDLSLLRDLDGIKVVRERVRRRLRTQTDDLRRHGLDAAERFTADVVEQLGPWGATWWLDELVLVVEMKACSGENAARFLRGHFRKPETIVLTHDAGKRPTADPEWLELLRDVLRWEPRSRDACLAQLHPKVFRSLVALQVGARWSEPEMKVLRRWLRATEHAVRRKKATRRRTHSEHRP